MQRLCTNIINMKDRTIERLKALFTVWIYCLTVVIQSPCNSLDPISMNSPSESSSTLIIHLSYSYLNSIYCNYMFSWAPVYESVLLVFELSRTKTLKLKKARYSLKWYHHLPQEKKLMSFRSEIQILSIVLNSFLSQL